MNRKRGLITVISGPSGCGKGTLIARLLVQDPSIGYAVSATTREKRAGEEEGVHYYFHTEAAFDSKVASGEILEWDAFCGFKYGTLRSELAGKIETGQDVLLDLTADGALAIRKAFPHDAVTVFILPPSLAELENRIRTRARETEEQLRLRVEQAAREIPRFREFDYTVVNDDLESATDRLWSIIKAERSRSTRNETILDSLHI